MPKVSHKLSAKQSRKQRVSGKMSGTAERPRLSVFRSNAHVFLQAIDDQAGQTLASASSLGKKAAKSKLTKTESAVAVAKTMSDALKAKKISAVVFDRGASRYHGRVKAVAEALRESGVKV